MIDWSVISIITLSSFCSLQPLSPSLSAFFFSPWWPPQREVPQTGYELIPEYGFCVNFWCFSQDWSRSEIFWRTEGDESCSLDLVLKVAYHFTKITESSLICRKSVPHFENLSPCCIYFVWTSSANTVAVLLWLDGCFLSLKITPRHLSALPLTRRAADDREEI